MNKNKRQFKKKAVPFANKKVDANQNKRIEGLEKKFKKLDKEIESKTIDKSTNAIMNSEGTSLFLLNNLAQGTTSGTRVGDEIRMTSMQIRGWIQPISSELGVHLDRLLIVLDKQSNGAAPVLANVLKSVSTTVIDPYNKAYVPERFKILYDKTWTLNPKAVSVFNPSDGITSAYAPFTIPFKKTILLNKKADYGLSNNNNITDISSGSIYAFLLSTEADASATNSTCIMMSRIFYRDA